MKLAFMTFACPNWTVPQIIDGAQRFGYHGVEIRVDAQHAHGLEVSTPAETRREAVRQCADAGLEIPCIATSLKVARSGKAGQAQREAALPLLDLAVDLGAKGLRIFGGEPVRDDESTSSSVSVEREEAITWAVENLKQLAPEAQSRGVEFWFETHDYFRLGGDTAAVIRQVDHPSVLCNWDVMHPQCNGEEFAQTKVLLDGIVAHTHFHDTRSADPHTICAFGDGTLPLTEMLRWLQSQNFDGYLSAEFFGDSLGTGPEESLSLWADGCRRVMQKAGVS
jgi:sugar phosphate isomerase/epimerase